MTGDNCQVKARARALPESICDLEANIASLEGTMYALRTQLYPVLDPEELTGGAVADAPTAMPNRHADQISDVTSRIRDLREIATDLMNRLHV